MPALLRQYDQRLPPSVRSDISHDLSGDGKPAMPDVRSELEMTKPRSGETYGQMLEGIGLAGQVLCWALGVSTISGLVIFAAGLVVFFVCREIRLSRVGALDKPSELRWIRDPQPTWTEGAMPQAPTWSRK